MSIYSQVPISKPRRNVFNLSHSFKGMINIGELLPICRPIECIPYDTFITGNISKVELAPIVTNFSGELYFETWQFFVSNDMLFNYKRNSSGDSGKFSDILVSLSNPEDVLRVPTVSDALYNTSRWFYYLGYKNVQKSQVAYPARALNKIFNDWFRDENLQVEKFVEDYKDFEYYVNYKKDRFTSAFLSTQKGIELKMKSLFSIPPNSQPFFREVSSISSSNIQLNYDGTGSVFEVIPLTSSSIPQYNINFVNQLNNMSSGISINDLRLYNRLQRWLEKLQLIGSRTKEYLLGNYGIAPNDETLDRPVLIGHTRVPVVVDPIVSNIKQENQGQIDIQNYQGSRGGIAGASSSFKYGKWLCKEFGWILTLGALRPKACYKDGLHRSLTRTHVVDYYNEIFSHLGQQPVYNYEVSVTGNQSSDDLIGVFGFQDIYNELRHIEDFIAPDVATNFPQRNLNRNFNGKQILGSEFIKVNPSEYDYLFAVPHSSTVPHAFFTSYNVIKAVRPIAKRSIPSL